MFDEVLIASERLTRSRSDGDDRLAFKVRLPWYRSLYLSCLEGIDLSIGDELQAPDTIFFKLYGTTYPFDQLTKYHSVLWFVLDEAEIIVGSMPLAIAEESRISLTLFVRIPYHRTLDFRQVSTCSRLLRVEERIAL